MILNEVREKIDLCEVFIKLYLINSLFLLYIIGL